MMKNQWEEASIDCLSTIKSMCIEPDSSVESFVRKILLGVHNIKITTTPSKQMFELLL